MSRPSHLTCQEAFARLADYVDRELAPDELEQVREHLDLCGMCAREYAFETALIEALKEKLCRIDCPSDLAGRIRRAIRREQESPGS